ncbi:hypothetical protein CDO52_12740 [Nocardiopsis gilva YIM 90087]|uniref:Uncharacterized protein n=1 Tax=Nocardiopsis gilva YIM 90087 TaxID=1235441 RepID=A0A223S610_9ACTN|nr:hypothetical protein [Nocardiopsis gilva]ASU83538.1 hypothetical protein CDO52_12740 [Nocardiopsis gilva YIM 90087]
MTNLMTLLRMLLGPAYRPQQPIETATPHDIRLLLDQLPELADDVRGSLVNGEATDWRPDAAARLVSDAAALRDTASAIAEAVQVVLRREAEMAPLLEEIRAMEDLRDLPEAGEDR